ncbi:MAG: GH3 family domain-containing protein, partial [Sediminibacterium sp.]
MNLKSILAKPFAQIIHNKIRKNMLLAVEHQDAILHNLIRTGSGTQFGGDHKLKEVNDYQSFTQSVPLRDYEQLKNYIEEIKLGKPNILWKGKPIYLAKTSGTTSGVKYIPITKDSIPNHIQTARNALL